MTDKEIDKLSNLFIKYKRYSNISGSMLSTLVHESDCLEHTDSVELTNMDMSWLFHMVDGIVNITADPKRVDLTNLEVGLSIIETLIYVRGYCDDFSIPDTELLEIFETEVHKSMSEYYLTYEYNPNFNIKVFKSIVDIMTTNLSKYDNLTVVGWVNTTGVLMTVIEGL